jgi:hypothetical protein
MHTFKATSGTVIHHNGDFSGDVLIHTPQFQEAMVLPFSDLKELVAKYVRSEKISKIEKMSTDTLLESL